MKTTHHSELGTVWVSFCCDSNSCCWLGAKFRMNSSTVVLSSVGPTSGLLSVSEGLETKELMDKEQCLEEAFENEVRTVV